MHLEGQGIEHIPPLLWGPGPVQPRAAPFLLVAVGRGPPAVLWGSLGQGRVCPTEAPIPAASQLGCCLALGSWSGPQN